MQNSPLKRRLDEIAPDKDKDAAVDLSQKCEGHAGLLTDMASEHPGVETALHDYAPELRRRFSEMIEEGLDIEGQLQELNDANDLAETFFSVMAVWPQDTFPQDLLKPLRFRRPLGPISRLALVS